MPIVSQASENPQVGGIPLPSCDLRSYTELNCFIIAAGLTGPYRLWLLCRSIDSDGCGVISLESLRAAMAAAGLSPRILSRVRQLPQTRHFLTFHPDRIEYRSLEGVCTALGVVPGRSVFIPVSCLGRMEDFRAALYTAWIAGQDEPHISREKLSGLFNVSAHTQRRWERLTGVHVTYNVIEVATGDQEVAEAHIPKDARLDDRLDRSYSWEYQGSLYYRTVNQYQAPDFVRGRTGNTRKVAKAVRCSALPVYEHGDGTKQSGPQRRVFFTRKATPANYQETSGASVRNTNRVISTSRGSSRVWRFSRTRPVARSEALAMDH